MLKTTTLIIALLGGAACFRSTTIVPPEPPATVSADDVAEMKPLARLRRVRDDGAQVWIAIVESHGSRIYVEPSGDRADETLWAEFATRAEAITAAEALIETIRLDENGKVQAR